MNRKKFNPTHIMMLGILVSGLVFTACKDSATSPHQVEEQSISGADSGVMAKSTAQQTLNVFKSGTDVRTYDVILATGGTLADGGYPNDNQDVANSWESLICKQNGSIGLDAGWTRTSDQYAFDVGNHPWESTYPFDAAWINAVETIQSPETYSGNQSGPNGGQNWTRYDMDIKGDPGETYKLALVADNCSWVYLDGNLVGFQGAVNPTYEYGLTTNGNDQVLSFIIWDGNGLAGGKFRMETTTTPPPPIEPEEPEQEYFVFKSEAGIQTWDPIDTDNYDWRNRKCTDGGSIGLDANWVNPHDAYSIRGKFSGGAQTAAFERFWNGIYSPANFDADWIFSENSGQSTRPTWTKYELPVNGTGDFELKLLADDCSWIYLDGNLVGYQDDSGLDNEDNLRYGLSLTGEHTLSFIIYDQGGEPGGKFILETSSEKIPEYDPPAPVNNAPVANAGADISKDATGATTPVTLNGSGSSDADGDDLSYSWTLNGSEVATGATPSINLADGNYTLTLTVSDGVATDSDDVNISVINTVPVADAGDDISKDATGASTPVMLNGSGSSDADGDALSYSWMMNGTEVATGATPTISLADGEYTLTLTVSDGQGASDSDEVNVSVVNTIPVAEAGADISKDATGSTTPVTLNGSGSSDADGDVLSYTWTLDGTEVATGATSTISLADGDYTLTLTVSDGQGASDTDEVNVSVVNTIPVADAGADQTHEATGPLTEVSLSGSATDADGDELTYAWSNGDTGTATTVQLGVGIHFFTMTVTDEQGATDSDEVMITITDTTAPVLSYVQDTASLWPPNHKMVKVLSGISSADLVDGNTFVDITVSSNEAANGKGDGNTASDYEIVTNFDGSMDVYVRAERSGKGKGRTYTISLSTSDVAGNFSTAEFTASVAKSQGRKK